MPAPTEHDHYDPDLFVPELSEAIKAAGFDSPLCAAPWLLALMVDSSGTTLVESPRNHLVFNTGDTDHLVDWEVESMSSLFRGEAKAPPMDRFPERFVPFFLGIEINVLNYATLADIRPTDGEMREIYNSLRRHPDGRSRSLLHDHVWKACALALGTRPWSRHEYEAVLRRLERSCRTFSMGPVSRNYVNQISKFPR